MVTFSGAARGAHENAAAVVPRETDRLLSSRVESSKVKFELSNAIVSSRFGYATLVEKAAEEMLCSKVQLLLLLLPPLQPALPSIESSQHHLFRPCLNAANDSRKCEIGL